MMRGEKVFVTGIVAILLLWTYHVVFNGLNNNPSELGKRITQGINCVKYQKDCPKD